MLTAQERQEMIACIRRLPEILEAAVKGLNDQQLDTPYGEGKWTVRQVVHHVADSHMVAFGRIKLILTEEKPQIKPYNQEEWAKLPDVLQVPIDPSLAIINGLHQRWSTLLAALPADAWRRPAFHPEHGDMILDDFLRIYSHHGESHVASITRLRAAKGW
ncbi:MAG: YfiT family bacillithiol transferase [Candidatus Zixiibacteriota bacterium]